MFNVGKINNSKNSIISGHDMSLNYANERRAIITFALIFISSCLTTVPLILFQVMRSLSPSLWCKIPHLIHFMVIQLYLSSTALDPFLVMRDRDIRKRLKHLFCCHNNCGKYYSYWSNIHPEMAHSRDFDAIRSVAAKALNLVSPMSLRDTHNNLQQDTNNPHHCLGSGSAPAGTSRPLAQWKLPATSEENNRGKTEGGSNEYAHVIKKIGIEDNASREGNIEDHNKFKYKIIYSDTKRNRECIEVSMYHL